MFRIGTGCRSIVDVDLKQLQVVAKQSDVCHSSILKHVRVASYFVDFWMGAQGIAAIRRCVWNEEEEHCRSFPEPLQCGPRWSPPPPYPPIYSVSEGFFSWQPSLTLVPRCWYWCPC